MSWLQEILDLAQPADRKVSPTFGPHHVAVALMMIGREQPLGRYELRDRMSIGEGSTRTLIKRLSEAGYITAEGKQGQKLTQKGQDLFERISEDVPLGLSLNLGELVVHSYAFANLVKGRAYLITDGVRQRDEAIIQGGYGQAGATTLVQKNGLLVMPPDDYNILLEYEDEALLIMESLRVEDDDVVVIGSAADANLAREVSMAAVMTMFDEE
ncbi:MAG: DUF4443 domain-containing protein [Candidatus Thorarchaeota archaeon]